jgi:hypothetical protein
MTKRQVELVAFLAEHGPARHDRSSHLRAGDGASFPFRLAWLERYAEAGVIRRVYRRSPKFNIPSVWYAARETEQ